MFYFTGFYLDILLIVLFFGLRKKKKRKKFLIILITIIAMINLLVCLLIHVYTPFNYVSAFQKVHHDFEKQYVLTDWKNVDMEAKYNKYLPLFEEAEKANDPVADYITWLNYVYDCYDGHVAVEAKEDIVLEARQRMAGNDYGFSMITRTNGKTEAVLVEEGSKAYALGLRNGCVITSWNGKAITEAKENIKVCYPGLPGFPDKENEEAYQSFFLAGQGGEILTVGFLTEENSTKKYSTKKNSEEENFEKLIRLEPIGNYAKRLETAMRIFRQKEATGENLSWKILENQHGYVCINSEVWDFPSGITGNYEEVYQKMKDMLLDMKAAGVKDLIIDLRNNTGGDDRMGMAIMSAFSKEDCFYFADGKFDHNDNPVITKKYIMKAKPVDTELSIVVLVNSATVSAGDGLAYNLSKLDQVTLMGTTTSLSSFQAVGGQAILKDGIRLYYPVILQLDENGEIMIDTDENRISPIQLDVNIPITKESIQSMFVEKKDSELQYAIHWLEEK